MMHALVPILLVAVADEPLTRFTFTEPHMGTRFQLTLYAPDEAKARAASKAAFERIAELDRIMSDYKPDSELMQLCKKSGGAPVSVGPELFHVLAHAQEIAGLSDGAFDVTIGRVSRLWRRARKSHELPSADELAKARDLVGYKNLILDPDAQTVRLAKRGMMLDLGGIGKGYAADEAQEVLKKHGITRALVAAGGDIVVSGPPPDADGWSVGVAPLNNPNAKPSRYLVLKDSAVSTSGDFEQHIEIDGKRYSHLIDPRTGVGLSERLSVTVIARHGIYADPLTKAVSVLGAERGLALIESLEGTAALIVQKSETGEKEWMSKRFQSKHAP